MMAIRFVDPATPEEHAGFECICAIVADSVGDITALGEVVDDGTMQKRPEPGSVAFTADMSVVYMLSPARVWTKAV